MMASHTCKLRSALRRQPIVIKFYFGALAWFAKTAETPVAEAAAKATLSVKAVLAQLTAGQSRLPKLENHIGIDCAIDTDMVFVSYYFQ
ncbi:hypothetical protein [Hymenobacter sp.]|uniref:hypothetical protein n=1 Tax=Hymenobacter sp. TaxID=1898978 RepID=UPI002D80198A|nr:hypothetical protein [Hymenobacter sp.]